MAGGRRAVLRRCGIAGRAPLVFVAAGAGGGVADVGADLGADVCVDVCACVCVCAKQDEWNKCMMADVRYSEYFNKHTEICDL